MVVVFLFGQRQFMKIVYSYLSFKAKYVIVVTFSKNSTNGFNSEIRQIRKFFGNLFHLVRNKKHIYE